jgi:hypothetical protein
VARDSDPGPIPAASPAKGSHQAAESAGITAASASPGAPDQSTSLDRVIRSGKQALPALHSQLADASAPPDERLFAARALIGIGSAEAIQIFAETVVREKDDAMREHLMTALDGLQSPEGIEMLASLFSQTRDPVVLAGAEDAISRLADEGTVAFLRELHAESAGTPAEAGVLQALSGLKNPRALPALAGLAADASAPDPVFAAAATALMKSDQRAGVTGLLDAWGKASSPDRRKLLQESIANVRGDEAIAALQGIAMDSPHEEIRAAAAIAIRRHEDDQTLKP